MNANKCRLCAIEIETENIEEKLEISDDFYRILIALEIIENLKDDYLTKCICSTCNEQLFVIEKWIKACQLVQKSFNHQPDLLIKNEDEIKIETVIEYLEQDDEQNDSPTETLESDEAQEKDVLENHAVKESKPRAPTKYTSTNKKQYKCTDCGVIFSGIGSFRKHRKCCEFRGTSDSRRKKTYTCEYKDCGKILASLVGYNAHTAMHQRHSRSPIKESPKELPVFLCNICGKTFKQGQQLQVHILYHQKLKPFECQVCEKRYFTNSALKEHMITHGDERKFKCETCGKDFFMLRQLRKHRLIHNADARKINCPLCPKKFIRPYQLRSHMMVHSGEKPYTCVECNKIFRFSWDLRKHVENLHNCDKSDDSLVE